MAQLRGLTTGTVTRLAGSSLYDTAAAISRTTQTGGHLWIVFECRYFGGARGNRGGPYRVGELLMDFDAIGVHVPGLGGDIGAGIVPHQIPVALFVFHRRCAWWFRRESGRGGSHAGQE
ncbi:hypothetical protein [Arthrobacter sp. H14]|uniref:hypothetical protein n=1 Tax=Arthrobacter sp. H14 TaxID=1312959 RepID=UPI000479DAB2|nr:hypothetical protein [Arthrobacter sp. H14]